MNNTLIIYRMGSLGDTVVALPCFHKIVETYPNHHRIVLTNSPVSSKAVPLESILRNGGFIHEIITYPYGTRSPRLLLSIMKRIRSVQSEALIYIGGGRGVAAAHRDLLFFRLAGIKRVIGAPLTRDLDSCRLDQTTGEMEPEVARLARCLTELGHIDVWDPKAWDLRLTPEESKRAGNVLGKFENESFIAVNTGGKLAIQDWGEANWIALLSRLNSIITAPLVFIGGAEDSNRAKILASHWHNPFLDACGQLSPRETAALLQRATLFVGHESGPMHLASAYGVPCVVVFGNNNPPGKWYPQGAQHRIHYNSVDVRLIPAAAVEKSVVQVWMATNGRSDSDRSHPLGRSTPSWMT